MAEAVAKLTPKQTAFVAAYAKTGNATEAYRLAYNAKGMSENSINREAKRMLDHPKIAPSIAAVFAPAMRRAVMDAADTIAEIAGVAVLTPEDPPKYSDKLNALQMMAKHHGLFEKDNNQRGESLQIKIELV